MATYYVSIQRGNNGNNGTSPVTPWLTTAYAMSMVAAGDTVYIGPGDYFSNDTRTLATAGMAGSPINFIGDPTVRYVTGDTKGRVVLSHRSATGYVQAGAVLDCNSKGYNHFVDLIFDGSADTAVLGYGTCSFTRCVIQGQDGGISGAAMCTECFISAALDAVVGAETNRCVLVAGRYGANGGYHTNTLVFGGEAGFVAATCFNCTAIGAGNYGYKGGTGAILRNCTAMNCGMGFYGSGIDGSLPVTLTHCAAVQCQYGFYGTNLTYPLDVADSCLASQCVTMQRGGGYVVGTVTEGTVLGYDWYELLRVCEPYYEFPANSVRNSGDNTYLIQEDGMGRFRPAGDGVTDRGVWEYNDDSLTWAAGEFQSTAPAWKVYRSGEKLFYFPAERGQTITVSVWAKYLGTDPPQLDIRGAGVAEDSIVHSAGAGNWQKLQLVFNVNTDGLVEFVCRANDTTANYSFFSDPSVAVGAIAPGIVYGSVSISGVASSTSSGTVIEGGSPPPAILYYGNPNVGWGSANFAWLKNNTAKWGISFVANKTGNIDRILLQWKVSSGYGLGTKGVYELQLYAADANGFPTGAALKTTTGWTPPTADGTGAWTISPVLALTLGNAYCLTIRNTDATPDVNWASPNTAQTPPPAGSDWRNTYLANDGLLISNGYFGGSFGGRGCYYNGSSWSWWHSDQNPYFVTGNTGNGSLCPLQLRYDDGERHGTSYYSGRQGYRSVYGLIRLAENIVWPHPTIQVVGILTPWGTWTNTPADSLYYRIKTSAGAIVSEGLVSAPFTPIQALNWDSADPEYITAWKSIVPTPFTLTQGAAYRIEFYSPNSTSGAYWSQTPIYAVNDGSGSYWRTEWGLPNCWGGGTSVAQQSTNGGTTWVNILLEADLTVLFKVAG